MKSDTLAISKRQYLELRNIGIGSFAPLAGFMTEAEFTSVVETLRLPSGDPFPLPVVLDINDSQRRVYESVDELDLVLDGTLVGSMTPSSFFSCDKEAVARKVFGTVDMAHPGVEHFMSIGDWFVGGSVKLADPYPMEFSRFEMTPSESRAYFQEKGWKSVTGFQTRNVPHRAHEYLLRLALEQTEGLFIQPLVGRKKKGDYAPQAILTAYTTLIDEFLPGDRIALGVLSTAMRYAGPREALFHAIIRRNYGCTHFIVGRDHAGVGDYYGKYAAHELVSLFDGELGIAILKFHGPFYCQRCDGIVTERTCAHIVTEPELTQQISGTDMRAILSEERVCPSELMRPRVLSSIHGMPIFIEEEEA
jgi:sulfate adenylyltransferase